MKILKTTKTKSKHDARAINLMAIKCTVSSVKSGALERNLGGRGIINKRYINLRDQTVELDLKKIRRSPTRRQQKTHSTTKMTKRAFVK